MNPLGKKLVGDFNEKLDNRFVVTDRSVSGTLARKMNDSLGWKLAEKLGIKLRRKVRKL